MIFYAFNPTLKSCGFTDRNAFVPVVRLWGVSVLWGQCQGNTGEAWGLGKLPHRVFSAGIPAVKKEALVRQVDEKGRRGRRF